MSGVEALNWLMPLWMIIEKLLTIILACLQKLVRIITVFVVTSLTHFTSSNIV